MPKKRFSAEQIVVVLRQIEVLQSQGKSPPVACRIVGQSRGTQRYSTVVRADEDALTGAIVSLASQYGRYGYRSDGWQIGCDRVQGIWRREGLKSTQEAEAAGPALAQ